MAYLTFELGFDWNMPPSEQSPGFVFPLQMYLVDNAAGGSVVSACHPGAISAGDAAANPPNPPDTLDFRVYDITDPGPSGAEPQALQVLFSTAVNEQNDPFSPIKVGVDTPVSQLATTDIPPLNITDTPSIAYGTNATCGWNVSISPSPLEIRQVGRFELRAMVTLVVPGEMARFYRIDPEMVVGGGGTGT